MAKQELTVEQILEGIDERIELLGTIKAAVRYAFTGVTEAQGVANTPTPTPKKRKAKRAVPGKTMGTALLAQVLEPHPMTTDEIYARMQSQGWHTASANPRSIVSVMLGQFAKKGKAVRYDDGRWSLPMAPAAAIEARHEAA